ncbi:integral membrane regulatory protein [Microlunatus endophyticus]|uniref:Integral membrane regulatory protein n=1 Tax=Microlunatus endophyticus TaxID=1716077 RepID=A0A917SHT9_9ACTN|nr:glycosyltransferase family 2 protein [Microlunatus endophyticus]GGL81785.1 integral membrane regulatory protein [Microlunatus endophyticus]
MDDSVAPGTHPDRSADPGDTTFLPRVTAPLLDRPVAGPPAAVASGVDLLDPDDPWAWASVEDQPVIIDISHCRVTAVLVSQNAGRWLAETLTALAGLTRRPDRVIAIDNESTDNTLDLLDDAIQRREIDAVYLGRHGYGYGDAIRSALSQDAVAHPETAAAVGPHDWLWLLHDDAAPAPEALAQLLGHVVSDPTIDITGPKLLRPRRRHRPYQISEIGVSISSSGRRHLGLDTGEIDQGQRDQPARRLAVSSCAMLVRRSVWDELGGFDPAMPGFRDGVEFGWRAQLAGHKVLTTPASAVVHRQVGRAGLRPSGVGGSSPEKIDREFGMALVAAHAPAARLPFVWLRLVLGSVLRAIVYLIGKAPGRAGAELAAARSFVRHPRRISRMRHRIRSGRITPRGRAVVERLRPGRFTGIKAAVDVLTTAIGNRYVEIAGTEPEAASLDELTSDELPSSPDERRSNPWFSPIVITVVLSVITSVVAARRVIGLGSLAGPQLLPITTDLGRLWHNFLDAIPGAPHTTTAPWTGLVAAASTIFFGQPEWLVTVLLVGTVPLALLSVYPLIRRTIDDRRVRLWVAVSYALLPVLLGGSNQGRLVLSVAAIMLPVLAIAGRALVLRRAGYPEAWRGGWGAGVALTVLGAFVPALILIAALTAVVAAFTVARTPRKIGRLVIAIGVPVVILSPWWPTIFSSWGRLLTGPDPALEPTAVPGSAVFFLFGRDGGAGLPPLWVGLIIFGSFWAVGLVGLLRGYRRRAVIAGWLIGLVCLAVAVGLSRLLVEVPPAGVQTRPYVGIYLLTAFGALILAGGIGVDGYTKDLGQQSFSVVQPLSVLAGVLAAVICMGGAGWWVLDGMAGPIHRTQLAAIPSYIVDEQTGPNQVRTLAIDLHGSQADYSVIQGDQSRLGDPERGDSFGGSQAARNEAAGVVARLVSGSGDTDLASDLADLGINYVWVSGANDDVRSRITNTPGLAPASGSASGAVWQLSQPTSRVRLVSGQQVTRLGSDPDGVRIPASSLQRVLRLGVPVDPRWQATLDGRPLTPLRDGNWQQSFTVPAAGGVLRYHLDSPIPWLPLGQGIALLITLVLAAPGIRRPEVRDPVQVARRVAAVGPNGRLQLSDSMIMTELNDLTGLTMTGGLITTSDGVTTSTGGTSGENLLGTTTLESLRRGEAPVESGQTGPWKGAS